MLPRNGNENDQPPAQVQQPPYAYDMGVMMNYEAAASFLTEFVRTEHACLPRSY
jgi:hypothetical protein